MAPKEGTTETAADAAKVDGIILPCEGCEIADSNINTLGEESQTPPPQSPVPSPPPPAQPHRWGVLRHKHFRTIWFASFGSNLGGWMEFIAVRWIVAEHARLAALEDGDKVDPEFWMGILASAQLFPTLFLGMFAGLVADSVNRRKLMLCTQASLTLIALGMALVAWLDPTNMRYWLLLTLAQGITVAFNAPAWQVLTPRLVPRDELTKAITLQGIQFNMARVLGPAIGGAIMGWLGPAALLLFNATMFVVLMFAVSTTPDAPAAPEMRGKWKHPREVWLRTREAMVWVFTRRGPRAAFLAMVVFAFFATPLMQLLPLFVSKVYGLDDEGFGKQTFGIIIGVMGLGAVSGGLAMKRVPKWYPMHHLIPLSIMLGGVFILAFALCDSPWVGSPFLFFVGWFWMWAFNSSMAAMQMLVQDSMRGRVLAVCNTVTLGLMPLGTFLAGGVGHGLLKVAESRTPDLATPGAATQWGIAFNAAVLVVAGIVMLIWRTPEVDGLKPGDDGHARVPGFWRGITGQSHRPKPGTGAVKSREPAPPADSLHEL